MFPNPRFLPGGIPLLTNCLEMLMFGLQTLENDCPVHQRMADYAVACDFTHLVPSVEKVAKL